MQYMSEDFMLDGALKITWRITSGPAGHASYAAEDMVGFLGCTYIYVTLHALLFTIMQKSHSLKKKYSKKGILKFIFFIFYFSS